MFATKTLKHQDKFMQTVLLCVFEPLWPFFRFIRVRLIEFIRLNAPFKSAALFFFEEFNGVKVDPDEIRFAPVK